MHGIDQLAYGSVIRDMDPKYKFGLTTLVVMLCLILNCPAAGILAVVWAWGLAVIWARIDSRVFGRLLLAEGTFLALTVIGIAVNIGTAPIRPMLVEFQVGTFWLTVTPATFATAVLLVARAFGCAAAMNFLALTTPMVDLIDLMRRVHVPDLLIELFTLIYRFIGALSESLERMYTAQDSRLGYSSLRRSMTSVGLLGSQLFIDAYRRSQRLQLALDSRCYDGQLRVLPGRYRSFGYIWVLIVAIVGSMGLTRLIP